MDWSEAATYVPPGTGLLAVLAALAILVLRPSSRVHRAFALMFGLEGLRLVVRAVQPGDPQWAIALGQLAPYLFIARPFTLLWFGLAFRAQQRGGTVPRSVAISIAAGATLLELWYAPIPHDTLPWNLASWAGDLTYAALGFWLILQARIAVGTARRRALLLAGVAWCFFPLAFTLHLWIPDLMPPPARTGLDIAVDVATLLIVALGIGSATTMLRDSDARVAAQARVGLGLLVVPVATVAGLWLAAVTWPIPDVRPWMIAIMGGWFACTFAIMAYTLLRGDVFGMEHRLKVTFSRSVVASFFVAVFLVVSKLVENFVGAVFGTQWVVGAVVAGIFLFALTPLQRLSDRLAGGLMPGARAPDEMAPKERLAAYREQAETAWSDGVMGVKERRMLDGARAALRLDLAQATAIEQEVVRTLGSRLASAADLKPRLVVQQG